MIDLRPAWAASAVLSAALLAASLGSGRAGTMTMTAPENPADRALMSGMTSMQRSMEHVPIDGDADHDFASMMMPHHQGAIDMARTELRYGRDPALRRMAGEIIAAQQHEIGRMQAWIDAHPGRAAP